MSEPYQLPLFPSLEREWRKLKWESERPEREKQRDIDWKKKYPDLHLFNKTVGNMFASTFMYSEELMQVSKMRREFAKRIATGYLQALDGKEVTWKEEIQP